MCANIDQLRRIYINSRKFLHGAVAIIIAMAVLCLASPSSFAAGEPRVIDVRLGSYYIKPEKISVKVGEVVTLSIINDATLIPHNLVIEAPEAGIHVKVDVSAGKSASITFTPTKTGSYEILCSKKPPFGKSHKEKGMHGTLEVMP